MSKLDPSWIGQRVKYIYGNGKYRETDYIVRNIASGGHLAFVSPAYEMHVIDTMKAENIILKSALSEPQPEPESDLGAIWDNWNGGGHETPG